MVADAEKALDYFESVGGEEVGLLGCLLATYTGVCKMLAAKAGRWAAPRLGSARLG